MRWEFKSFNGDQVQEAGSSNLPSRTRKNKKIPIDKSKIYDIIQTVQKQQYKINFKVY